MRYPEAVSIRNARSRWIYWILGCVLFGVPRALSATSIVIIRTDNGFVVAADSRLSDNSGEPLTQLACKIHASGPHVVWGYAGLMADRGFNPELDLSSLISGTDLDSIVKRTEQVVIPALVDQAKLLAKTAPDKFTNLLSGNDIFRFFLVTPKRTFVRGYKVSLAADESVNVTESGTIDCVAGLASCPPGKIMRVGEDEEMVRFVHEHPAEAQKFGSYTDFAKYLVGLEIDAKPKTVGPPIDVASVSDSGTKWVSQKIICAPPDDKAGEGALH